EIRKVTGNLTLTDEAIDTAWNSLLIGVRTGHHELLNDLKKRYRTFLLSNNNEIHYAWIMAHLKREVGLNDNTGFFEKDYYSHLLRMRNPDREIFDFIVNRHSLDPTHTLFVDDSPQHIEAARQLGLQAHQLEPSDSLPSL